MAEQLKVGDTVLCYQRVEGLEPPFKCRIEQLFRYYAEVSFRLNDGTKISKRINRACCSSNPVQSKKPKLKVLT